MASTVFFYLIAAFVLFSAYFVVTARNLFRCAVGLISVLVGIAGTYLLMDAQFLSAMQITVYVGGIVVLIVFAILLVADVTQKVFRQSAAWRKGVAGLATCLLGGIILTSINAFHFNEQAAVPAKSATVGQIGQALLSPNRDGFILPFEVISLVLLAALIGAVTVARSDEEPSSRTVRREPMAHPVTERRSPLLTPRPRPAPRPSNPVPEPVVAASKES